MCYSYRYIAKIVIESKTPLSLASGECGITVDSEILVDYNGYPFIPGTSITGVLRHCFDKELNSNKEEIEDIFGFAEGPEGKGSRIKVSSAYFIGKNGKIGERILPAGEIEKAFQQFPDRQHVRINDRGVSDEDKRGKFDQQIALKGSRFVFELEFEGKEDEEDIFRQIVSCLFLPEFRLGGGTRNGFGEIEVKGLTVDSYDLQTREGLMKYINRNKSLCVYPQSIPEEITFTDTKSIIKYELKLRPDDFFIFSSGVGSLESDMNQIEENVIEWNENKPVLGKKKILIPASSLKGAIAHRVAFHYNKRKERFVDYPNVTKDDVIGANNEAVMWLFGYSTKENDKTVSKRGKIVFSDVYYGSNLSETNNPNESKEKLSHINIDRFTGGVIGGALFNEVVANIDEEFNFSITLVSERKDNEKEKEEDKQAIGLIDSLEDALRDVKTGMLPLGGGVNRGHGCFTGRLFKNGEEI